MSTEFIVSASIIFWGEKLNPHELQKIMDLDAKFCGFRVCGEEILRKNGGRTGSYAKTSRLSFNYTDQFPSDKRDPEKQFDFILNHLKNIEGALDKDFSVDSAELQLSIYYSESEKGVIEFFLPKELQAELVRQNIDIRITALP